ARGGPGRTRRGRHDAGARGPKEAKWGRPGRIELIRPGRSKFAGRSRSKRSRSMGRAHAGRHLWEAATAREAAAAGAEGIRSAGAVLRLDADERLAIEQQGAIGVAGDDVVPRGEPRHQVVGSGLARLELGLIV